MLKYTRNPTGELKFYYHTDLSRLSFNDLVDMETELFKELFINDKTLRFYGFKYGDYNKVQIPKENYVIPNKNDFGFGYNLTSFNDVKELFTIQLANKVFINILNMQWSQFHNHSALEVNPLDNDKVIAEINDSKYKDISIKYRNDINIWKKVDAMKTLDKPYQVLPLMFGDNSHPNMP